MVGIEPPEPDRATDQPWRGRATDPQPGPWYVRLFVQILENYGLATLLAIGMIMFGAWLFVGKVSAIQIEVHDHVRDNNRILTAMCRIQAHLAGESDVTCDPPK